jgi:hypothetical protein
MLKAWSLLWPAGKPVPGGMAMAGLFFLLPPALRAQDNYEVQVYGSETTPARAVMLELHSNYTVNGQRQTTDGTFPSNHAWHETLEITYGFNSWFETGFYVFTSIQPGAGFEWVGDHIRPRVRAPEEWHWPVGVSLSTEVGYQRRAFSVDTWTWESRPIVDKEWGPWYFAVNPAVEKSLQGRTRAPALPFHPAPKSVLR